VGAQNKILPPANATVEGSHSTGSPFAHFSGRTQQIWLGSAVATKVAIISGIRFRRDVNVLASAFAAQTYSAATVSLGATKIAPNAMSSTFATNSTGKMTTVLNATKLSLPALAAVTKGPADFNIAVSWSTPYPFASGSSRHLLLDMSLPGSGSKRPYHLDAQVSSSNVPSGIVSNYGSNGRFSRRELYTLTADPMTLHDSGKLNVRCGALNSGYRGMLILGLSDKTWGRSTLPLDLGFLGAPNNKLYASFDVTFPFDAVRNGATHQSNFVAPIPKGSIPKGLKFYAQAYYADTAANGAGLVASHGLALTAGASAPRSPITQQLSNTNPKSSSGTFPFGGRPGGAVVQFVGFFQ